MASFSYTAKSNTGDVIKGVISAGDRSAAVASLSEKGLTPILIKEESPGSKTKSGGFNLQKSLGRGGKVSLKEKVVFSRQFATMINAGVPLVQSLHILQEQTDSKALKKVLTELARKVQGGSTLADSLAEHPKVFPPVYVNMVRAGETGGILDQVLDRLATQQEKDAEIVSKVRGAMIYPSVITTVTIGAFFFMMTVIVPKMATVFENFGADLPGFTKFLLSVSKMLTEQGTTLLIAAAAIGFGLFRYIKTPGGKRLFDKILLRLPIFGPIVRKVNIARFARTFGSLMSSGISVLDSLKTTSQALGNSVYKDELARIADQVKNGKTISEGLRHNKNFPPLVGQMILVGEETGKLDEILVKVASFYEKEVENVIENLTSIIEPLLILVIGGMVGSIVIGVLGPLGQLTQSL